MGSIRASGPYIGAIAFIHRFGAGLNLEEESRAVDVADVIRDYLAAYAHAEPQRGVDLSYTGAEHIPLTLPGLAIVAAAAQLIGAHIRASAGLHGRGITFHIATRIAMRCCLAML